MSFDKLEVFLVGWSVVIFILAIFSIFLKFKKETENMLTCDRVIEKGFKKSNLKVFEEHRFFERLKIVLRTTFSMEDETNNFQAITRDISSRGIGLLAKAELPINAVLELTIEIPGSTNFTTKGIVVWAKKSSTLDNLNDVGIKFNSLITNEMIKIFKHLNRNRITNSKKNLDFNNVV